MENEPQGTPTSEVQLFIGVRENRSGAWEKLVKRYSALVYAVPRQLGLSRSDAEEVSQATWMIAYRHLHLIEKPKSLPHWLITTASREAWKLHRARSRREKMEAASIRDRSGDPAEDPAELLERLEQTELVRDALGELPTRCAEILAALYLDSRERSYQEIGEALGIPVGSVGPTRMRCLAHLARILEPRLRP